MEVASAPPAPSASAGLHEIKVVSLPDSYREHRISSDGQLVVLDEIGSADDALASSIVLVDLAKGAWRPLAKAAGGYHPWTPVIWGDTVAWVEWKYLQPTFSGPSSWRVVVMSLTSGKTRVVASGTNARLEGLGAPPPPLALDGNQLAFAVQDATASRPWGWQIEVMDLATGHVLRTIPTQEEIYGFGLSAGTVAYSEGTVDTERGFIYQTRLMVSTPAAATPREIAADAFELSFRDDRLGWVADVEGSQQRSGLERTPRVWTATNASWTPVPVTAAPPKPTTQQQWPAAAAGTVSFDQLDVTDDLVASRRCGYGIRRLGGPNPCRGPSGPSCRASGVVG